MVARYSKENFPNILKLADGLKEIGKKYNATAGQIALAWVLAQGEDFIPIAGTTKIQVCSVLKSDQHEILLRCDKFTEPQGECGRWENHALFGRCSGCQRCCG